jgi:hypothetical protein
MLKLVRDRIFQIVVGLVLIFAALTPLVECFDHWDGNVVPATDTELRTTALFAVAGLVLAMLYLVLNLPGQVKGAEPVRQKSPQRAAVTPGNSRPEPTSSPRLVPLRI